MSFSSDPLADGLTRLRNAVAAGQASVRLPYSQQKHQLVRCLLRQGYIRGYTWNQKQRTLEVQLKYKQGQSPLAALQRISTPKRRIYASLPTLWKLMHQSEGDWLLQTSKGVLTGLEALRLHRGGEVMVRLSTSWRC